MSKIIQETGCIFDTLVFLAFYFDDIQFCEIHKQELENIYYHTAKQKLAEKDLIIPNYIYPFVSSQSTKNSFLYEILFESRSYIECTCDKLISILQNKFYIKRKYVEFYFPDTNSSNIQKILSLNSPDIIDILKKRELNPSLESFFLNTLFYFELVIETLINIVQDVHKLIAEIRLLAFANKKFSISLKQEIVLQKFKALTNLQNKNVSIIFSITFMKSDLIQYKPDDPSFILVGCEFEQRLELDYKYLDVTPYSFAKAISNPTKYDIYQALKKSPMCASELELLLNVSRSSLTYSLKEMLESRLVIIDHKKGLQFFYKLNIDFLNTVAKQLFIVNDENK